MNLFLEDERKQEEKGEREKFKLINNNCNSFYSMV